MRFLEVVGVINELGNIEQAIKRKPWLSEKDDKAWRNWWYSRGCFEKVYRVKSSAGHEGKAVECHATETLCSTCGNDFRKCVAMTPNA